MVELFLKIANMSITASWLILAVILLRVVLKKAPKYIRPVLWGLVAVRLVCPISFESIFSLIPSAETLPEDIIYTARPTIQSGIESVDRMVNPVLSEALAPTEVWYAVNPTQVYSFIAAIVWILGMIVLAGYAVFSYIRLRCKLNEAVTLRDNIRQCDHVESPFILGIIRPHIYLPSDMDEATMRYVIAHENAHLSRKDHWWKPLAYALLIVHWFNPLCWAAYILLCRDIELACDEKVVKLMNGFDKKAYSTALLSCSVPRRMISACPLAFGEVSVKERVKSVLNYKKPAFWISVAAVMVCVVAAVCFLTDPVEEESIASETERAEGGETFDEDAGNAPEAIDLSAANIPEAVVEYAQNYVQQQVDYYNKKGVDLKTATGMYEIVDYKITGLTMVDTGTASEISSSFLYLLEYRLKPDAPEKVVLEDGMTMEDGWITEWTAEGQPHILHMDLFSRDNEFLWSDVSDIRTNEIMTTYGKEEMLKKYQDAYRAACMELYSEKAPDINAAMFAKARETVFAEKGTTMTLILEDGSSWKTFSADNWQERLEYLSVNDYRFINTTRRPPEMDSAEYQYKLQILSADRKTYFIFYPLEGGFIEYYNGKNSTFYEAVPLQSYAVSITEDIRQCYDNMELDTRVTFDFQGNAEEAAEYYVQHVYGDVLLNLDSGNGYAIKDYAVINWGIKKVGDTVQISEDGSAVAGWFSYAMIPWDDDKTSPIWAGNTIEASGEYAGWLSASREFVLEKQEDGSWKCTGIGTGGYTLPD